tara:strand:- start:1960 stop:2826 length:867 start_codon:yes stop_codon:yes gene_type:complete
MVQFTPFGESSLFSTIVGGGGTPLGAVPMDFATATPFKFSSDPITPEPDTPESSFDMGVFCSMPANANHPMCVQNDNGKTFEEERAEELYIPTDEEIANMTNEEYIQNLTDRGWLSNSMLGYLPSKGNMVKLDSGQMPFSPYFTLAFGKLQEAKRNKMMKELQKRGFLGDLPANPIFEPDGGLRFDRTGSGQTNAQKTQGGLLMIDDGVKPYKETKGTEVTGGYTKSSDDRTNYADLVEKGKINIGQAVNQARKNAGYFSPAQTRDREKSYAQPQGKKGTYSYRAKGR